MWVHLDYEFVLFYLVNPKRVTHGLLVKTIDQPRFHNAVMNAQLSAGLDGVTGAVVVLSSHQLCQQVVTADNKHVVLGQTLTMGKRSQIYRGNGSNISGWS